MKRLNIALIALLGIFAIISCSEDNDPVIGATVAPILKALPADSYILAQDKEGETFATFSWDAAQYGLPVAIQYTLQMDIAGNNFASSINMATTSNPEITLTNGDINKELLKQDLPAGEPVDIEFRVVSAIEKAIYETSPSNNIKVSIMPYSAEKVYPMLYTPGEHQGWAADKSAPIYAIKDNDNYEGYLQLSGGFKFTSQPNWDGTNYGMGESEGTLSTSGGNITAPAGYFYVKVNVKALTYTLKPMEWGIIGSATPAGWDSDTKLIYDPATMTLKLDINLIDGEIKFRANSAWDDALGGSLESLTKEGGNIVVAAGNYTITLDLHKPQYSATMVKK